MDSKREGRGPRMLRFDVEGVGMAVVSLPLTLPHAAATLTEAERDVCEGVLRGASNASIAARRGTSVRTVANQVQMIFHKLGVGSRNELAAWVAGFEERGDAR